MYRAHMYSEGQYTGPLCYFDPHVACVYVCVCVCVCVCVHMHYVSVCVRTCVCKTHNHVYGCAYALYSHNTMYDYGLRTSLAKEVKGQMSIVTVFTRRFGPI